MNPSDAIQALRASPQSVPALRVLRKGISREIRDQGRDEVLAFAHRLIQSGVQRFVAYEIVLHHKNALELLTETEVEQLGRGMRNWA